LVKGLDRREAGHPREHLARFGRGTEKVGSRSALWVEPLEGFHADPAYAHTLN
jgi:hypothetical protein